MPNDESADGRIARELARIKQREADAKAAIEAGRPEVDVGPFSMQQLGLSLAVVDAWGRIWRHDGSRLTRIYPQGG